MKKKIMSATLALVMLFALLPVTARAAEATPDGNWTDQITVDTPSPGGSGTENSPWVIKTAEQLACLSTNTYANTYFFKLGADIDLSAHYWTPIGHDDNPFKCNFDGNGYTIYGMHIVTGSTINKSGKWLNAGFFGRTASGITIQNVNIVNATIDVTQSAYNQTMNVGGLGGYLPNNEVTNCSFSGSINAHYENSGSGASIYVGGIVGRTYKDSGSYGSNFTNCAAYGSITASSSRSLYECCMGGVGGLTSYGTSRGKMKHCYANCALTDNTTTDKHYFGGVVGYTNMWKESSLMFYRCYSGVNEIAFGYIQSGLEESSARGYATDKAMKNQMRTGLSTWNYSDDVNDGYPIPAALYEMTYDANGGSGSTTGKAAFGYPLTLPASNPTQNGYTFTGWYDEDGTQYTGGTYLRSEGITLYAHWVCSGHIYDNSCDTTCNTCGETRTISHSWTAATCTSPKTCSVCHVTEGAALGHDMVTDAAVAATCTETGLTEGSHCSRCNDATTAQTEIAALGHSWGDWFVTTPASCTATGTEKRTCTLDGNHFETRDIAATGHTEVTDAAVAATCAKTGLTEGKHCSVCGAVIVAQTATPTLGHIWGSWSVTTPATCTAAGVETRTCSRCSNTETREITATGHTEVTDAGVASTCTGTGLTQGSHCSVCHAVLVEREVVAARGHTKVTDPAVAPTCTTAGKTVGSHCSVCGTVITAQETVPALQHDYIASVTAPTCTDKGYTTHTCSRCDDSYVDTYVNATGHSWGIWTSNGNGTETRTCANDASHKETKNSVFTITYAGMDGATHGTNHPGTHTYGTPSSISDPSKPGYTFAGWQVNSGGNWSKSLTLSGTAYTADITLTAHWTLNAPTVTLAADNASVTYGASVTLTATPSHDISVSYNYEWYKGNSKINGESGDKLTLSGVSDSGSYTVKVTASDGSQTSAAVTSSAVSVTISAAAHDTPTAPSFASKTYNSITVTATSGQKYICQPADAAAPTTSATGWQDTGAFTGLNPNTAYKIYTYRPAADGNHADSPVSEALEVTTNKVKITAVTAPANTTLTDYYTTGEAVKAVLAKTAAATAENSTSPSLTITWTPPASYNTTPSAENTFTWGVSAPPDYEFADGVASSGSVTVTNKAATAVSITGTNKEITYSGGTYDVSQLFSFGTGAGDRTYTLESGGSGTGTLRGSTLTITKAGTINIKVETAASGNYAAGEQTATLTVKPASGAGTVSMSGYTYGGTVSAPSVSGKTGAVTYYYSRTNSNSDGTEWKDIEPTTLNAGDYWLYAKIDASELHSEYTTAAVKFTVGRVRLTPSVASVTGKVYDGRDAASGTISLSGAVSGQSPTASGTFKWVSASAETTKVNVTGITLGSGWTTNYELSAAYLTDVTAPNDAKISKAPLTVTAKSHALIYGDELTGGGVSYDGFVSGESSANLGGTLGYDYDYTLYGNIADSYTLTPKGITAANYAITFESGTLTVSPRPVTVTIADKSSVYGAPLQTLTASVTKGSIVHGDSVYTLSTTATPASAVSDYAITGAKTNDNYTVTFAGSSGTQGKYSITNATLTGVSVTGYSGTYDGASHDADKTVSATAVNGQAVTWSFGTTASACTQEHLSVENVADSKTYYYKVSAPNHEDKTGSFSVSISAKDISGATVTLGDALTYNGAEQTQAVEKVTIDGLNATFSVSDNKQTNAKNDYSLTVTGTGNFTGSQAAAWGIAQRKLTITAKPQTITYGESISAGTAQVEVSGLVGSDALDSVTLTPSGSVVAGDKTIAPDAAVIKRGGVVVTDSYAISYKTGALTITSAAMTPTVSGYDKPYDGKAHGITVTMDGAAIKYGTESGTYDLDASPAYADVGEYTVFYQVTKENYSAVTGSAVVKITPKSIEAVWSGENGSDSDFSWVYDGLPHAPTAAAATGVEGETVALLVTGAAADYKASAYTATAAISPASGNYTLTGTTKTFNITKADYDMSGVSFTDASEEYDGRAHSLTVSGTLPTGADGKSVTVRYSGSATNVSSGAVTVTATFETQSTNYNAPAPKTAKITVTAAPLTVSVKDGLAISKIYDGDNTVDGVQTNWLVVNGLKNGETVTASGTWRYDSADVGDTKPVKVTGIAISYGSTAASNYSYTQTDISATGAVTAAAITPGASGVEATYDGKPRKITVAPVTVNAQTASVSYKTKTDGDYEAANPEFTNAGEYTVYYKITAPNHADKTGSAVVKISPKPLTADMIDSVPSLSYDGEAQTPTPKVSWTPVGESELTLTAGEDKDFTFSYENATAAALSTAADAPTVTITAKNGGNYSGSASKAFTIDPLTAELEWSGYAGLVYDGADKTVTAAVSNRVAGDDDEDFTLVYSDNIQKNAGDYTAAVTALGNSNYALPSEPTIDFTIAKAPISFTAAETVHTYSAQPHTATVTQTQGQTPVIAANKFSVSYQLSAETATASKTDAGEYAIIVTLKDDNFCFAGQANEDTRSHTLPEKLTIGKKAITTQWKNLIHVYDGAAKAPEFDISYKDLFSADSGRVSAELGADAKASAGTYTVTATLTGSRAANYRLTNPTGSLIIQKAPVTFTVSGNSVPHDGSGHLATVTAVAGGSPFADFTVSYKNAKGETVTEPTDEGSYDIYAAILGSNHRHADAADGAARKIGVMTIYRAAPPPTYTVSFAAGDGATGNVSSLSAALPGTPRVLPENPESGGFAKAGNRFGGWKYGSKIYQPGETLTQPATSLTLNAVWIEETYLIEGVVDEAGAPLADVVVTLMLGSRQVAQTQTDGDGKYSFTDIAPGLYNLVASRNGVTKTILVEIVTANETGKNITMPSQRTNSVVEVAAGSPSIVVGKLEQSFASTEHNPCFDSNDDDVVTKGGAVEIKLTASATAATHNSIEEVATGTVGLYLDMTLTKTVTPVKGDATTERLTESASLLEMVINLPGELQGKDSYTVYRVHEGVTGALTPTPNESGEYIAVNAEKTAVTVYAKYFSTYALAFTARSGAVATPLRPVIAPAEHGSVSMQPSAPVAGERVTLTLTPEEGFCPVTVTVTDNDGKKLVLTQNSDGTYSFTQPAGTVTITARFRAAWNPFADVKPGDWFHDDVRHVYESALMQGTGDAAFSPHLATSRGMIVTILWRLEQEPGAAEALSFTDVAADKYYAEAVAWAAEHGIVEGYSAQSFRPEDPITREQLAAIFWRYAKYKGYDVSASGDLSAFTDEGKISSYAKASLSWANATGLINGTGGGSLDPLGSAERCQVAAILRRFCESCEK